MKSYFIASHFCLCRKPWLSIENRPTRFTEKLIASTPQRISFNRQTNSEQYATNDMGQRIGGNRIGLCREMFSRTQPGPTQTSKALWLGWRKHCMGYIYLLNFIFYSVRVTSYSCSTSFVALDWNASKTQLLTVIEGTFAADYSNHECH